MIVAARPASEAEQHPGERAVDAQPAGNAITGVPQASASMATRELVSGAQDDMSRQRSYHSGERGSVTSAGRPGGGRYRSTSTPWRWIRSTGQRAHAAAIASRCAAWAQAMAA